MAFRGAEGKSSPHNALDQLLDRHDPSLPKGEQRQQGIALASGHGHRASARRYLERAEDADLEGIGHAGDHPQSTRLDGPVASERRCAGYVATG